MKEKQIRKKVIIIICTILVVCLAQAYVLTSYARDKNAKCHRCKDKDLKLVQRHKIIGYDGCLKCHDDIVKTKPKNKNKKRK